LAKRKIGIDYTAAIRQGAGVGRHTRSLVAAILEQTTPDLEFSLFYAAGGLSQSQQSFVAAQQQKYSGQARFIALPFSEPTLTRLWQRLKVPLPLEWVARLGQPLTNRDKVFPLDVLHFPDFALPYYRQGQSIVTIHDLSFMVRPECAEAGLRRYLSETVPRTVKRADQVIVVSESIKQELIERLRTPAEKLHVIYNGVSPQFRPFGQPEREALEEVRTRHALPERFALFVSTIEPRKNLVRLVEAWAKVKQTPAGRERKLILVGRKGWLYEPIFQRIAELKLENEISWLNFVPDDDLPALYNLADLFVFPSLYEGFGIPPLEALACGRPVVVADNSAMAEIFKGAATLCQAESVNSIAEAIIISLENLDNSNQLIKERREEGLARAHRLTWQNAALQTLKLYRES